jgi:PAS domain S-box-containing protein
MNEDASSPQRSWNRPASADLTSFADAWAALASALSQLRDIDGGASPELAAGLARADATLAQLRAAAQAVAAGRERLVTAALAESNPTARAMLDAALDAILTIDEHGHVESANPAAEKMFGYEASEILGRNVSMLMPSPYREEHDGYVDAYLKTGHRKIIGIGREVLAQRKDGSVFPIELAVSEVWQGPRRFFMGTIKDLTARKQLEAQLLHAQKMEAVGRLAGGVAHDFNNLLASITGYAELLADRVKDDSLRHAALQIRRGADRGAALTRQLLAFSRNQKLQAELLDVNAVVLDLQDMLERLLGERVELELRLAEEPLLTLADRGQLQQVIVNLVVNARDAMSEGGRISIDTHRDALEAERRRFGGVVAAGDWIRLTVADNGCGMSQEVLSHIFEPFFTTKELGKGTGLGLSTVYGIVRQTGGSILVDTREGQGSTFEVYLPRTDGHAVEGVPREVEAAPVGAGETVLLVEDDSMLRELLADVLGGAGYRVLVAADPAQALALSPSQIAGVQLLVSDQVMPGMRGSELAQELLRHVPGLQVILMSGYSEADEGAAAPEEVAAHFLQKPFSTKELLHVVRQVLERAPSRTFLD